MPEDKKKEPKYEDRFEKISWFKRLGKLFQPEPPSINMPKRQPCPKCNRGCPRKKRLTDKAIYKCGNHGTFEIEVS